MELAEGTQLDIWYGGKFVDDEPQLHCNVTDVNHEEGTVTFLVINGAWEGKLFPGQNLIQIGLWSDAEFRQIDRFQFYDKNYFKTLNKLKGIEEKDPWWDDDIPFRRMK